MHECNSHFDFHFYHLHLNNIHNDIFHLCFETLAKWNAVHETWSIKQTCFTTAQYQVYDGWFYFANKRREFNQSDFSNNVLFYTFHEIQPTKLNWVNFKLFVASLESHFICAESVSMFTWNGHHSQIDTSIEKKNQIYCTQLSWELIYCTKIHFK